MILQIIGSIIMLLGSILAFNGVLGIIVLTNPLSRMHSNAKPQTLGAMLILLGAGLTAKSISIIFLLILAFVFLILAVSVTSQLIGKTYYNDYVIYRKKLAKDAETNENEENINPTARS